MKHAIKFTALALALCSLSAAQAQGYVGGSISRSEIRIDGLSKASPSTLSIKLGSELSPNFAVEARLGKNVNSDSVGGGKVELNTYYGLYGKGILPVTNLFSAYGLLGYTRGEVSVSGTNSGSDWDQDLSYGVGVDFAMTKNVSFNLEWARLFKGNVAGANYKVEALSLGANYKF